MKKTIVLFLIAIMIFTLSACGSHSQSKGTNNTGPSENNSSFLSVNDESGKNSDTSIKNNSLSGADGLQELKEILNVFNTNSNEFFTEKHVRCMSPIMFMYLIEELNINSNLSELLSMNIGDLTAMLNKEVCDFLAEDTRGFSYYIQNLNQLDNKSIQLFKDDLKDTVKEFGYNQQFDTNSIETVWAEQSSENENIGLYIYSAAGRYYWFWLEMF